MEHNLILTDILKTGNHQQLQSFIDMHSLNDQTFECTGDWYSIPSYDLKKYKRKFAVIDHRMGNYKLWENDFYWKDLYDRIEYLVKNKFVMIVSNPWESKHTIIKQLRKIVIEENRYTYWTGGSSWFWWMMFERYKDQKFDIDHSKKIFDFFYLNKQERPHRIKLFKKLQSEGLLADSLYSFLSENKNLDPKYELPWVDVNNYPKYGKDRDIYELPYNHSSYNIVSETHDFGETFITEKIWKPILMKQIFIVHSKPNYLQELNEMGFKTFSTLFDESYDKENDNDKRIDAIVKLCKFLKDQKAEELYKESTLIRDHNSKHFFNRSALQNEINKTLLGFIKFFDGTQVSS